jgi:hypothetical protein
MSIEPDVLFYMPILFAVLGAGVFLLGVWQLNQADNMKKFVGCVLQGSGLGVMGASAIFYFAKGYDWAFIAVVAVVGICSTFGALSGFPFLKAQGMGK